MKVFITQSIGEEEQFWISRLAWSLRDQDINPITGNHLEMINPNLMIGIATVAGNNQIKFLQDYQLAQSHKIPFLLLIEKGCDLINQLTVDDNVVIFDRGNLELAIETAKNRFTIAEQTKFAPLESLKAYWGWLVGGAILLATIGLLLKMTKPEKV
jgi:hypothetical protein